MSVSNHPAPEHRQLAFVAVGPQKTATTWLHRVLEHHPDVALPLGKETYFFDRHFGAKGVDWLWWHYREGVGRPVAGEVAPSYFHHPDVPGRIHGLFPQARIIVNARNPVRRAFSLFRHHLAKNRVEPEFWAAAKRLPVILETGHYSEHVPRWEGVFGADRVSIIVQEDVENNPERVIAWLYGLLGVRAVLAPENLHTREGGMRAPVAPWIGGVAHRVAEQLRAWRLYRVVDLVRRHGAERMLSGGEKHLPQLTPELYGEIYDRLKDQVDYLEQRLNRDFPDWRPEQAFGKSEGVPRNNPLNQA